MNLCDPLQKICELLLRLCRVVGESLYVDCPRVEGLLLWLSGVVVEVLHWGCLAVKGLLLWLWRLAAGCL